MNNEHQEFFISENEEEIKAEKAKQQALIKYLPGIVGNEDRTTYVLRRENAPARIIGTDWGEECKNKRTTGLQMNDNNTSRVGHNNVLNSTTQRPLVNNSIILDKTETGSPWQGNNYQSTMMDSTSHDTGTRHIVNNSSRQDTIKGSKSDSLWHNNVRIDMTPDYRAQKPNKNNQQKALSRIQGLYTGGKYTRKIEELKSQLPPKVRKILEYKGTEIRVLDNFCYTNSKGETKEMNGIYSSNKITLGSKHMDIYTLLSEAIYAVQDYLGMTDSGNSNLEFQEHVIKDLYLIHKSNDDEGRLAPSMSVDNTDYQDFISKVFDSNGVVNLDKFLKDVNSHFKGFQENYAQSNSYQTPIVDNFNYNWKIMFEIFGIPCE